MKISFLLIVFFVSACSKDNFDATPKTDDFLFFKLTHGSVTRELHSTISASGDINGLIFSRTVVNDSTFLNIQSQIMATVGNPNYSFSISSQKKGSDIIGNYTDEAANYYSSLIGMGELSIKPGTVYIYVLSASSTPKYGNYIEGSFAMTLTKAADTSYSEPASGTFRLKEF